MRRGAIDQILMMMMVFVFLVTLFFLIVDYSSVAKVQNQLDIVSRQGSRLVSLGKSDDRIVSMINSLKTNYFKDVIVDDIVCQSSANDLSKVLFKIEGKFHSRFKALGSDGDITVTSTSVAYNENGTDEINCSVVLVKEGTI